MKTYFYDLSGGINQSISKTAMGLETKKLYWSDSKNIELLQNRGIIRQNGNTLLLELNEEENIIGLHPFKDDNTYNLLIATAEGHLYIYETKNQTLSQLEKTVNGTEKLMFVDFLDGVVCASKKDGMFYINNDPGYTTEDCNLKDSNNNYIFADCIGVYKGRIWVGAGATLYYSALGKYNDFTTAEDAGYINNFHTDTNNITALKTYKEYLAIYKENSVYLLSGTTNEDFQITPFADKGTASANGVITVNNRQYFINQGMFTLEQAGLLSQIQLGEEVSLNIKNEFEKFNKNRFKEIILLHYEAKNQIWCFIPYNFNNYLNKVWIYNYVNNSWFKREIPQNIVTACLFDGAILTADSTGKIYKEDFGNTFDGEPIEFMWKSPFMSSGTPNVRKTIEEFFFVLDESYDNNFNFSVYKDFDSESKDDEDTVVSSNLDNLVWWGENLTFNMNYCWNKDDSDTQSLESNVYSQWANCAEAIYKAEISESNYSVQLCIEGSSPSHCVALIGVEFKEVFLDE